jgi:hypothetical protein
VIDDVQLYVYGEVDDCCTTVLLYCTHYVQLLRSTIHNGICFLVIDRNQLFLHFVDKGGTTLGVCRTLLFLGYFVICYH